MGDREGEKYGRQRARDIWETRERRERRERVRGGRVKEKGRKTWRDKKREKKRARQIAK